MRRGVSTAGTTPLGVFTQRFEALFPHAGTLGCTFCLVPQFFIPVYAQQMWDYPATALPRVLSTWLSISTPPPSLYECFFFNSLVVGLPCSSIFWQFWMFFVFKFVVVLLLVVQGSTVYRPTPPSWPEV